MRTRKQTGTVKPPGFVEPGAQTVSVQNSFQDKTRAEIPLTRRGFCNRLVLTSTGLLLAAKYVQTVAARQDSLVAYPPLKIEGAESLLPGSSLYFNYPTRTEQAILVRAHDGQYFAYSQKCSHRGCSIYFNRARRCLECPCHNGAYEVETGFVLQGPPPRPLDLIVLQMRTGGEVWAVGRRIGSTEHDA